MATAERKLPYIDPRLVFGTYSIAQTAPFLTLPLDFTEDLPVPADYDGDGRADVSVFRPSTATWYRQNSSDGSFYAIQFGLPEDKPTVGDFDGDGHSDIAIFRPSLRGLVSTLQLGQFRSR